MWMAYVLCRSGATASEKNANRLLSGQHKQLLTVVKISEIAAMSQNKWFASGLFKFFAGLQYE